MRGQGLPTPKHKIGYAPGELRPKGTSDPFRGALMSYGIEPKEGRYALPIDLRGCSESILFGFICMSYAQLTPCRFA